MDIGFSISRSIVEGRGGDSGLRTIQILSEIQTPI